MRISPDFLGVLEHAFRHERVVAPITQHSFLPNDGRLEAQSLGASLAWTGLGGRRARTRTILMSRLIGNRRRIAGSWQRRLAPLAFSYRQASQRGTVEANCPRHAGCSCQPRIAAGPSAPPDSRQGQQSGECGSKTNAGLRRPIPQLPAVRTFPWLRGLPPFPDRRCASKGALCRGRRSRGASL